MYRDIFQICSSNGETVHKDVYKLLLSLCKLDNSTISTIRNITVPPQGIVNRTSVYKTLALIAWCQQGKLPTDKLFDNYSGNGKLVNKFFVVFLIVCCRIPQTTIGRYDTNQKSSGSFEPKI